MKKRWNVFGIVFLYGIIPGTLFANGHGHETTGHFKPAMLIEPLGVLTLLFLISTFILGRAMTKNRKKIFPWHKRMSVITLISAVTHASIVLLFH